MLMIYLNKNVEITYFIDNFFKKLITDKIWKSTFEKNLFFFFDIVIVKINSKLFSTKDVYDWDHFYMNCLVKYWFRQKSILSYNKRQMFLDLKMEFALNEWYVLM